MRSMMLVVVVVVSLSGLSLGCGAGAGEPGEEVRSSKARITTAAPAGVLSSAVAGNTDFALALHRELSQGTGDNLFFSPHSITLALGQAYAGAAGGTASAFEAAMRQSLPAGDYHRAMNELDRALASRGQGAKAADGKAFKLSVLNQLFADKTFTPKAGFLDTLAQEYGAGVRLMDFRGAPEPSREGINDWVARATEERITELLPKGIIKPVTRAVLVNAIYFKAAWKTAFDKGRTRSLPFHTLDGATVDTDMMSGDEVPVSSATVDGVEVLSLPYDGDEMSLVVLMPPSDFEAFEAQLTAEKLGSYLSALAPETLSLTMPKFEHRSSANLNEPLKALGMGVAFDDGADFSAMTDEPVHIGAVVHQAFVKLNESGTEAAAATAVVMVNDSAAGRSVRIDKPFLYLVRDDATGAIVFMGRYVKP